MLRTHGVQWASSWYGGRWSDSKSPCVKNMSHQMTAKPSQDSRKLAAKTSRVHRHWASTSVVKMSCKKRMLRLGRCDCNMLQSPFLKIALRRIFLTAPGRNDFLKQREQTVINTCKNFTETATLRDLTICLVVCCQHSSSVVSPTFFSGRHLVVN